MGDNDNNLQELVLAYADLTYAVTPITDNILKMIDLKSLIEYYEKGLSKMIENSMKIESLTDFYDIYDLCFICGKKKNLSVSKSFIVEDYLNVCDECKIIDNNALKILTNIDDIFRNIIEAKYDYDNIYYYFNIENNNIMVGLISDPSGDEDNYGNYITKKLKDCI